MNDFEHHMKAEFDLYGKIEIPIGTWHKLSNKTSSPLRIIEIQYGEQCMEDDIERIE
jgi:mannose-6-phosphate isomerase-like protein (cupin superfamily)